MRDISLDLLRVTEAAAIAASKWIGSGDKEMADKAATDAMRKRLNSINFKAKVAVGEGLKDKSYGIFVDEILGRAECEPKYSIAIDPIEGTTPCVNSGPESISCMAIAEANSMLATQSFYMLKMAYGQQLKIALDLNSLSISLSDPIEEIINKIALATHRKSNDLTVCILNRPRHNDIIARLRSLNVRIKLIQDCDVSGAVAACLDTSGVDLLYGIGGGPEAVLSAAAIKSLRGVIEAKEVKTTGDKAIFEVFGPILTTEDLVKGECVFVATGITDGSMFEGVKTVNSFHTTHSVFMRSASGTIRWVTAKHGN